MSDNDDIHRPTTGMLTDVESNNLLIPMSVRSLVYLIGTIGFPILMAFYVVVSLSSDIRSVDRRLEALTLQIDERPMSLDRTTDFVVYVINALNKDLTYNVINLIDNFDFSFINEKELKYKLNLFSNNIKSVIRPIVRDHQRFSSRFPSIGGNIGSYFSLEAPSEESTPNDTEAYLAGKNSKDFAESVSIVLINLIGVYGNVEEKISGFEDTTPEEAQILQMLQLLQPQDEDSTSKITGAPHNDTVTPSDNGTTYEQNFPEEDRTEKEEFPQKLIDGERMKTLSHGAIQSMTTALRDQILLNVRLNSSQTVD